jgi:AhpD family alkylhydroperoxidase
MTESPIESQPEADRLFTPAVKELVALGAALACNCEPCLRHHYREAKKLGIGDEDVRSALDMAAMVKQTPARNALQLAERLLGSATEKQTR